MSGRKAREPFRELVQGSEAAHTADSERLAADELEHDRRQAADPFGNEAPNMEALDVRVRDAAAALAFELQAFLAQLELPRTNGAEGFAPDDRVASHAA